MALWRTCLYSVHVLSTVAVAIANKWALLSPITPLWRRWRRVVSRAFLSRWTLRGCEHRVLRGHVKYYVCRMSYSVQHASWRTGDSVPGLQTICRCLVDIIDKDEITQSKKVPSMSTEEKGAGGSAWALRRQIAVGHATGRLVRIVWALSCWSTGVFSRVNFEL